MSPLDQFRKDPDKRKALSGALEIDALQEALAMINKDMTTIQTEHDAPEIVSVRLHARQAAITEFVWWLFELTRPLPKDEEEPPMTFGTNHNVDEVFNDVN